MKRLRWQKDDVRKHPEVAQLLHEVTASAAEQRRLTWRAVIFWALFAAALATIGLYPVWR